LSVTPEKPDFNKIVTDNIINMKKRTSQIKGEFTDNLTDIISENFKNFFQLAQQLVAQIEMREKNLTDIRATLDKYEQAHPELKIALEAKDPKKSLSPTIKKQGK